MTLETRLRIVESVWPGTLARGYVEQSNRLVQLYAIEDGKDGGASPAEVERARALLLERMAEKEGTR